VVRASDIKREGLYKFKRNAFVIPDLEVINRAAYWDYQRERVYVKSSHKAKGRSRRKANRRSVVTLRPNTTIEYPRPRRCSQCKSKAVVRHTCKTKRVIDQPPGNPTNGAASVHLVGIPLLSEKQLAMVRELLFPSVPGD